MENDRHTGTVTVFIRDRGYGFIKNDATGKDHFVHISALQAAQIHEDEIYEGMKLTFALTPHPKGAKAVALEIANAR